MKTYPGEEKTHFPSLSYPTNQPTNQPKLPGGRPLHAAILRLGLAYSDGSVAGGSARADALLAALRRLVADYSVPEGKVLSRDLGSVVNAAVAFLVECRPLSAAMGSAVKFVKLAVSTSDPGARPAEAVAALVDAIDAYRAEKVEFALAAVAERAASYVEEGDVVLTYGHSGAVLAALLEADRRLRRRRRALLYSGGSGGGGGGGDFRGLSQLQRQQARQHALAGARLALSGFLKDFVDESSPSLKRAWRERTVFESVLDLPPDLLSESAMATASGSSSNTASFYMDQSFRFERLIFKGIEFDLWAFEAVTFGLVQYCESRCASCACARSKRPRSAYDFSLARTLARSPPRARALPRPPPQTKARPSLRS